MKLKVRLQEIEDYSLESTKPFARNSLKALGPEASPFGRGQRVLLEPNLLRGFKLERRITTHPVVVETWVLKD